MKNKFKSALIPFMLLVIALLFCACSNEQTQYDINDENGYTVSVKFDANGGEFTTGTTVIVDSFNISGMSTNAEGKVELALIAPNDDRRGTTNKFRASKNGYFLAGWYEREESVDSEGNVTYTYTNRWDFENETVKVDPNVEHTASKPQTTLYAVWAPLYEIKFIDLATNEVMGTHTFDPTVDSENQIKVPQLNTETGKMENYKFKLSAGTTYTAAYYDADRQNPVNTEYLEYPSYLDENELPTDCTMNVYVDLRAGTWYTITSAQQLISIGDRNGCYDIKADLDFTDLNWPSQFSRSDFTGTIQGNGHTISNVTITQTNNSDTRFGLFGGLAATAKLENVTFSNITVTIQAGVRVNGAAYAMFAGNIAADATLTDVQILGSKFQIDSGLLLMSNDFAFGKLCAMGNYNAVQNAEIEVVVIGEDTSKITLYFDEKTGEIFFTDPNAESGEAAE